MTNLAEERNSWREQLEEGESLHIPVLDAYKDNRNSESWRTSSQIEKLCEYVMFLEDELKGVKELLPVPSTFDTGLVVKNLLGDS